MVTVVVAHTVVTGLVVSVGLVSHSTWCVQPVDRSTWTSLLQRKMYRATRLTVYLGIQSSRTVLNHQLTKVKASLTALMFKHIRFLYRLISTPTYLIKKFISIKDENRQQWAIVICYTWHLESSECKNESEISTCFTGPAQ